MELRFGLDISTTVSPGRDVVGEARLAEALGFDFVSASDHPCGSRPSYETWTMLTWIAANTTTLGLATRVLGVPWRVPALTAKMAETLHRLSGNRLTLGLGGGSADGELRAFGVDVPTAGAKMRGLEDAIRIARGVWGEPEFTYEGARFRTERAQVEPKPERPIPIWLGTFGPKGLALAGRLADGWFPSMGYAPPAEAAEMMKIVRSAALAAGRDPGKLSYVYNIDVEVFLESPTGPSEASLSGRPDEVAEKIHQLTAIGFNAFNFMPLNQDREAAVRALAAEVIRPLSLATTGS